MRLLLSCLIATSLGLPVFAADTSSETKTSSDTSVNPITGTKKTTKKFKRQQKLSDGSANSTEVTKTTKESTSGNVEHKTEVEKVEAPAK